MQLIVKSNGAIRCLYDETVDLSSLGSMTIQRGSHVEPNGAGCWLADLAPVNGPVLGPFNCRSEALAAEHEWLKRNWLCQT
jgi:hypothetical protein